MKKIKLKGRKRTHEHKTCNKSKTCSLQKYYSLNSNVIVTYGYDCENGVDESVKTTLIFPGF